MSPRICAGAVVLALFTPQANATTWDCEILQACEAGACSSLGYEYSYKLDLKGTKAIQSHENQSTEWQLVERSRDAQVFAQPSSMDTGYMTLHRDGTMVTSSIPVDHGIPYILLNLGFCQERT